MNKLRRLGQLFNHWKLIVVTGMLSETSKQELKDKVRQLRQSYNEQTHAMDRRALAQAGIKLLCHTAARAGQLSMHRSFRAWQIPLLEKRATEPVHQELLSEIDEHKERHRAAMQKADQLARGLRAARLVEHTIRGAWCAHKQATMRVWAGAVKHRQVHRGAMTKLRQANKGLLLSGVSLVGEIMRRWIYCSSASTVTQWRANVAQQNTSVEGARRGYSAVRAVSQQGGAAVLLVVLRQWQRRAVKQAMLQMRENWVVTCMQILLQGKFSQQSDVMRLEMQKQSGMFAVRHLIRRSRKCDVLRAILCWKVNAAEDALGEAHNQIADCQATRALTEKELLEARHQQSELRKQSQKLEVGLNAAQSQSCKYQKKLRHLEDLQSEKLKQDKCLNQLVLSLPATSSTEAAEEDPKSVSALKEHNRTLQVLYQEGEKRQSTLEAQLCEVSQELESAKEQEQRQQQAVQALEDQLEQVENQDEHAMVASLQKELFGLRRQQQKEQIIQWKTQNGIKLTSTESELSLNGILSSLHTRAEQYAGQLEQSANELQLLGDPSQHRDLEELEMTLLNTGLTLLNTGSGMRQMASKLTECMDPDVV